MVICGAGIARTEGALRLRRLAAEHVSRCTSAQADRSGTWHAEIYDAPPRPAEEKVAADELGPYLGSRDGAAPHP